MRRKIIKAEEKKRSIKRAKPEAEEAIKNYERALFIALARKKAGEKVSDQYIQTLNERIEKLKEGKFDERALQRELRDSEILSDAQVERVAYGRYLSKEEKGIIKEFEEKKKELEKAKKEELESIKEEFRRGLLNPEEFERDYAQVAAYYDERKFMLEMEKKGRLEEKILKKEGR